MAALGHTVDSGSGASGDYASLNALEAAQQQDLTDGGGDTYTATCITTGDLAADTTAVEVDTWTTGAANYILITAGASHVAIKTGWSNTIYRLTQAGEVSALSVNEEYVRVNGLQIYHSDVGIDMLYFDEGATGEVRVSNCRLKGGRYSCYEYADGGTFQMWNTIIEDAAAGGFISSQGADVNIYNSIAYNCGDYGFRKYGAGTHVIKNSVAFVNGNDMDGFDTCDYCAADDTPDPSTNLVAESGGGANWPNDFADAANGDFTLLVDSNLKNAGAVPDAALYTTDIEGNDYNDGAYSLGVDEYVAAGDALTATEIATGAPTLETPTISQTHALTATEIATGAPSLATSTIGQTHALAATEIATAAPTLDTPTCGTEGTDALEANDIATAAPVLDTPTLGQIHALVADDLYAGLPTLDTATLAQIHALVTSGIITGPPELGTPVVDATHDLTVTDIALGAPVLGTPTLRIARHELVLVTGEFTQLETVSGAFTQLETVEGVFTQLVTVSGKLLEED